MDISRAMLDNLMGRDRNLPKNSVHTRDHYSNSDVCKPFLICFCFNTLFPNTIYDQGPCNKRHDTYLKTMFDSDPNRGEYQRIYIRECISWIERRIQEAEQKTKKNQNTIDTKTSLTTERPRQILDRILSIDKDIEEMMRKAAIFGENGQIQDSSRCLEQVQRLRQRRKEIDLMGDNLLAVVKQQKICEICGAIQTINDTEKRIQMHLQGKIHTGFLRLRTEIQTLKIRLEIIDQRLGKDKPKEKEKQKEKEKAPQPTVIAPPPPIISEIPVQIKQKEVQKVISIIGEKEKDKERDREREREKDKEKERVREDSNEKKKKKEHKHDRERRDSRDRKKRDRSREKHSDQRGNDLQKDRHERSRSKDHHKKDKDREHKKDKKRRDRSQEKEKEHRRSREREKRSYH